MKAKTFKIAGRIIFFTGLLVFLILLYDFILSIINNTVYSKYLRLHGDYWMLGYYIIPILFILLGVHYYRIGAKNKKVNKTVSASAILNLTASILGFIGFVIPLITRGTWDYIITILIGIPVSALILTGIVLLVIGSSK